MEITVYTRHSEGCPHEDDPYYRKCRCRKWLKSVPGGRYSAGTRSWDTAEKLARRKMLEHDQRRLGIAVTPSPSSAVTVEEASQKWLKMRDQLGKDNAKARRMCSLLEQFCSKHHIEYLTDITPDHMLQFRLTLPFQSGDSSSLKIHWSIMRAFFVWCRGMKYITESPIPSGKENPQFAIKFKKPEVHVPSKEDIETVINTATGEIKMLALLMRWSAMAINDALVNRPEPGTNLIRGNRKKTGERFRVRIPQWLADSLPEFSSTWKSPVHQWERKFTKLFKDAKVEMTSHQFRHYRISELLASGVRVEDVAMMVGTSPAEIRKTYQHWIKEAEDRLDEVQEAEFAQNDKKDEAVQ